MYLHTYSLSFKLFRSINQWYLHSLTSWWIIRRRLLFFPSPLPLSPSLSFLSDGIHFPAETCRFTRSPHTRFPRISVNDGKVDWLRLVFPLFFNFFFFVNFGFERFGKTAIWLSASLSNFETKGLLDTRLIRVLRITKDYQFKLFKLKMTNCYLRF